MRHTGGALVTGGQTCALPILKAHVTALTRAGINASQGASVVQVADGGLARIGDVLQRMKALAAQSLSGVPTDTERGFIDAEFQQLKSEITDMASTTRFNGQSLLDGSTAAEATASYFVGTAVSDTIDVSSGTLAAAATAGFGSAGLCFTTAICVADRTRGG